MTSIFNLNLWLWGMSQTIVFINAMLFKYHSTNRTHYFQLVLAQPGFLRMNLVVLAQILLFDDGPAEQALHSTEVRLRRVVLVKMSLQRYIVVEFSVTDHAAGFYSVVFFFVDL